MRKNKIADLFDKKKGRRDRKKALLYTVFLATSGVVMFAILGLRYQIPPPAEMGSFVIMGPELEDQVSMAAPQKGDPESESIEEQTPEESQPEEITESPTEAETETSTEPEAPEVSQPETPTEESKPTETPTETPTENTPQETTETETESTDTEQETPKGQEDGDESSEFDLSKVQDQNKSSGKTDGDEDGDISEGLSYSRKTGFGKIGVVGKGRKPVNIPDIDDKSQEDAIVYVKVLVKEDGTVFDASVDYSYGTTTASSALTKKAVASAKNTTFEKGTPGSGMSTTIIRYEYKVK